MAVSISERISVQKELHGRVRFVQGIPKTATGKGKIQHNFFFVKGNISFLQTFGFIVD
jgi:hypothetical protein